MKFTLSLVAAIFGASSVAAFVPSSAVSSKPSSLQMAEGKIFDQEAYIAESKEMRLKHLEEQAMFALKIACENYGNAVFPNAMIAGDVVITHLLHRMGYLKDGKAKVMVVDTYVYCIWKHIIFCLLSTLLDAYFVDPGSYITFFRILFLNQIIYLVLVCVCVCVCVMFLSSVI